MEDKYGSIVEQSLSKYCLETAMQLESNPHKVLEKAEEIEKFLIKSGDELHYAYSDEEILEEVYRRKLEFRVTREVVEELLDYLDEDKNFEDATCCDVVLSQLSKQEDK